MPDLPPPPPPPQDRPGSGYPAGPPTAPPTGPPSRPPAGSAGRDRLPWVVPGGPPSNVAGQAADPHGGADRRRRTLVVLAAAIGVLALLAGTVAFVGGDHAPELVASPTTTPDGVLAPPATEAPTATTDPAAPPLSDAELLALVDELEAYVAAARGLPFLEDVTVELADDGDFEARLLADFEEDVADLTDAEVFYRALGLLGPDQTLLDAMRGIYAAGAVGFYDPEVNQLVVRGTSATPYVQQTIVHELVHALDDQHFELHRPQYDDRKDEISSGFRAVIEGNAHRVENRWLAEQPAEVRRQAADEEAAFGAGIDPTAFPEVLLFQIGAPYQLGQVFVDRLVADGGERSVDAALTEPPDTSEQYLFPERYVVREPRVDVPVPPAGGEVVDDGVVGALFLLGLLTTGDSVVNPADALRAVEGWGGDWAVTWLDGDLACVRADFIGDADADTDELEEALTGWAGSRPGAQISRVDGRVRLDSCSAGATNTPPQV